MARILAPDTLPAMTGPTARPRRRPLLWIASALPLIAWAALYAGAAKPLTGVLEQRASQALGRDVRIGGALRVLVTPFSIYVTIGDVHVSNPSWAMDEALFTARRVTGRLSTFDLLIGRPGFRALDVRGGAIDLERSRYGKVNWRIGRPNTLFDLASVQQIDADDVTIRYRNFRTDTDARLALAQRGSGVIAFSGSGRISERTFALNGMTRSADGQPTSFDVTARTGGIALGVRGTADGPFRLAKADLTGSAKGSDFSELAALAGISLPVMPGYALKAQLNHAPNAWHFSRIEGRIGRTDLGGKLTLDQRRGRPSVVARLASHTLDLRDGMALLGLRQDPAPIDMADAGLPVARRLFPDADISSAALGSLDAVIDYEADHIGGAAQAPTQLSLRLALVKGVLTLSPVTIDLAGGFVSSDISIDGRRSPALARYDIRLSPTPMARLLGQWGVAAAGTTATARGRVQLSGRGETLRETLANASGRIALIIPKGALRTQRASTSALDLSNLNAVFFQRSQTGPSQVNCGLIAFTVRNGIATADPILVDTADNVLAGHGHVDLRNETIDLRLSADSKSFVLLNRSAPLHIGGTVADPLLAREPTNWFRPTRIFGMTMPLPNLDAIFGFVDPGDAGDVACGPVLRGAPAVAHGEQMGELADLR